jgi:hypothetical protein
MLRESIPTGPALRLHILEILAASHKGQELVDIAKKAVDFIAYETVEKINTPIKASADQTATVSPPSPVEPKRTSWTPERIDQLVKLYSQGKSHAAIAEALGVTTKAVGIQLSKRKLTKQKRPDKTTEIKEGRYDWTAGKLVELETLYEAGASHNEIASALQVSKSAVNYRIEALGLSKKYPKAEKPEPKKVGGYDAVNATVKALAANADPDWKSKVTKEQLKAMLDQGMPYLEIAKNLRAPTWSAIRKLAGEHCLLALDAHGSLVHPASIRAMSAPSKESKKRKCLKCGKTFLSDGAGNRLCPQCKSLSSTSSSPYDPL